MPGDDGDSKVCGKTIRIGAEIDVKIIVQTSVKAHFDLVGFDEKIKADTWYTLRDGKFVEV